MTHLGTFRKARHTPPPAGFMTTLVIIGYAVIAICCAGAVYRINEVAKIQTQEGRV